MKVFKLLIIVLFLLYNMSVFAASVEMSAGKSKAVSIFGQVDVSDNYTESLLGLFLPDEARILPLGIKRTIGNVEYSIAISKIKFGKEYSELTAWGRVKIPDSQGDRFLFFGADRIKLSNEGDIIGEAKLALLEDVDIPLNGMTTISLSGSYDVSSGRASSKTYMAIDCDGFKELGIDADITFSNQVIRKVDEKGKVNPADSTVKVSFYTVIEDWNNILLSIDLPDFEVVGLPDFMFKIKSAVLDFSDRRNAHEMDFPVGYEGYLIPGNRDLWRGVYIKYLEVFLPEQFALKEGGGRVSFSACNMLWDNNGISGVFSAKNVLPLESGDAGGWAFSVEDFSMNLLASNINGIGFSGRLSIPVGEFSSLEYEAMISPANEYLLRVSNAEEMNFDIWSAKAIILPSSYVELKVVDGRFKPEAILNGRLEVNPIAGGTAKVSMDSIHFRRLHFRTEAPYLSVDYLGYSGKVGIQGFPVCIENIALLTQSDEAQLGFDITLNLGEQPFSLTATGGLSIVGGMDKEKGLRSWKYKRLEVSKIVVDASQAGTFDLKGSLEIRNDDPVYGDGFEANIDMTINVLQGLNLKTKAIFGKLDYRYWLVDGAVSFGGSGIPVFSGLYINGFGGGASYHMIRNGTGRDALPTGSVYIPDAGVGLGLKAAVMLNFGNPEAVKGEASFEIVFTRKGGLAFIGFFGQVEALSNSMLTDIKANVSGNLHKYQQREQDYTLANGGTEELHKMKAENPTEAAKRSVADKDIGKQGIQGALGIQYNFLEKSFHATFEVHINMLGGMLRGLGKNNSAGLSVLHIDPREWYMNMGTPDNMLGVKMDLAGLVKMETGSYFMMGTQIPDSPPPPVEVANVLGMDIKLLDYMRNLNELGKGKGFAFGSHLKVSTGNLHFMMLYAQLEVGVGFDIMLKQYKEAYCQGRSRELGMNGWYANGQAYAYMQGEIGVHVNLLFIKKKIPILEAGAAMLMQAKLPNPAWFAGYLGLKFNVLNGLVKGNVRMKIELGEECILVQPGASPLDMEVIGDISPSEESQDVDVFVNPQVAFNIPVGKKIVLYDEENRRSTYRFMLNEFSVWHGDKKLEGKWEWNASGDMVSCELHDLLPSKDKVKVLVSVGFEELKNGQWEALYVGGEKSEEKKEIVFTTGEAPDHIPLKNIVYCSPVIEQ
ncbi:hypothetical protein LJC12_03945, partial [Odoribacter sp. OttesenSCG-928-J03]|nr:hypothetical protein [Odoribacter sp. OttesenSCG-928-J03]